MKSIFLRTPGLAGLVLCTSLLAPMTGCTSADSHPRRAYYQTRPAVQRTVVIGDDYDYYPRHEVYYSRTRQEYIYRDGRSWVRRSEPRGVSIAVLFRSPSVRMSFRDEPSRHHRRTIRTYPRHWAPPAIRHDDRNDRREHRWVDRRTDRNDRDDRDDRDNRDNRRNQRGSLPNNRGPR